MSMCRVFSCVVGRGCLLWPVHLLGKTLLVFALLHSAFQGQICLIRQVFLDFLLLYSSPNNKKEKAMSPHSSTLAWKLPWTEEPDRLQSMGSHRVGHDWVTSLSLFTFIHWRRKWQPTPVFLPGESQGRWSLVGCPLWGHTELDTTEAT